MKENVEENTQETGIVPQKQTESGVANKEQNPLKQFSLANIEELANAKPTGIMLSQDYWSPDEPGEKKRVIFCGVEDHEFPDQKTGEMMMLPTAIFAEFKNGKPHKIVNSSARLVATIQDCKNKGLLKEMGTALEITYLGKVKNKTNSNYSAKWDIEILG